MTLSSRKRSRDDFERDLPRRVSPQVKNHARKDPVDASHSPSSDSEWQTVSKNHRGKLQATKSAQTKSGAAETRRNYPSISHSPNNRLNSPIKLGDLQSLVLYILANGVSPQWVAIQHHSQIRRVVTVLVPGLDRDMFNFPAYSHKTDHTSPDDFYPKTLQAQDLSDDLQPLADIFPHVWPVKAAGDDRACRLWSPINAMLIAPLPKNQEDKKKKGVKPARESAGWINIPTAITSYLATPDQLRENDFAVHPLLQTPSDIASDAARREHAEQTIDNGWVETSAEESVLSRPLSDSIEDLACGMQVLTLDCEMCQTGDKRFELTRISVVDWNGAVLIDELVKPANPITNYLTQYSGITEQKLKNVTTTLAEVRARFLSLLTPTTILAGHSLNSDLNALKLVHPRIVDTSLLYPHPGGEHLRSSLKFLVQKYLGRTIQDHGGKGHDSVEDARAALELVQQKCIRGPRWGTADASTESIFTRISRTPVTDRGPHATRTSGIVDWGSPKRGHGQSPGVSVCIGCSNDDDVVAGVDRAVNGGPDPPVDFVWARMRELEAVRGWWNTSKTSDNDILRHEAVSAAGNGDTQTDQQALKNAISRTIDRLSTMYAALPACTAFIVYSGLDDPRELAKYQEMKNTYRREFQTKKWDELSVQWTDDEEQGMRAAFSKARQGLAFLTVK